MHLQENYFRNGLDVYSHDYILHRRFQQVGFRWHLWSPRLTPPLPLCLWQRPHSTHAVVAFPTSSPLRHQHRWLKCQRRTRVCSSISLFLSSMWPISRRRSSRCCSPKCKLPYSPSPRLMASPKHRLRRCPWLHLCCLVVLLLCPQMAPLQVLLPLQLLRGPFAPHRHPPLTLPLPALPLLLCLPVPKFSQLPRPQLFLWDKNETEAKCEPNVKVQEVANAKMLIVTRETSFLGRLV